LRQSNAAPYESLFCQIREALCIGPRPASLGNNSIIARDLAFSGNLRVDPPDSRMKEEHCFHNLLREVGPIIPTTEMGQFVKKNLIQLSGRELAHDPTWDQDYGLEEADSCRNSHLFGSAKGGPTPSTTPFKSVPQNRIKCRGIQWDAIATKNMKVPQSPDYTENEPERDHTPYRKKIKRPRPRYYYGSMPGGRRGKACMGQCSPDPRQSSDGDKCRKPDSKASRRIVFWSKTENRSRKQADQYALNQ